MIKIIKDIELMPHIFEYEVILFPMGINNAMYSGIAYEIGLNIPWVKDSENMTKYGDKNKLGTIHETTINGINFCACYIHNGGFHKKKDGSYVNYDALTNCFKAVAKRYKDKKKIATIVLGGNKSDGNGDRKEILNIINETLGACNVDVYDYEEKDYKAEIFKEIAILRNRLLNKEINREEYIQERSKIEWRRRNGIFGEMPVDYKYYPRSEKSKMCFIGKIKQ